MTDHFGYVAASYGMALLIVVALVGWVLLDGRARRRELAALDAAGIRRRSSAGTAASAGDTAP